MNLKNMSTVVNNAEDLLNFAEKEPLKKSLSSGSDSSNG